jgi:hypothetical protein
VRLCWGISRSVYVPLTYKGRTYLPLRAVGEAVGLPADYDAATKTAYLGNKPNATTPAQDVYINATPEYVDSNSTKYYVTKQINAERMTTLTGKTFEYGYCCQSDRFIKPTFKCDFQYKKLQFTLYSAWSQKELDAKPSLLNKPMSVEITDENGIVIKKIDDLAHGTEMTFDIDCANYKTLQVYMYGGATIIAEPKFVK